MKNISLKIIFTLALTIISSVPVSACSCVPLGLYFEEQVSKSVFIGIVTVENTSTENITQEGRNKIAERNINFQVKEEIYNPLQRQFNTFHQTRILEHEIKNCSYQCDSYISETYGGSRDLFEGETYLIMLLEENNKTELIASIPLNESGQTTDRFLQFESNEDKSTLIKYLQQKLPVKNSDNAFWVGSIQIIVLISMILSLIIGAVVIFKLRHAKFKE